MLGSLCEKKKDVGFFVFSFFFFSFSFFVDLGTRVLFESNSSTSPSFFLFFVITKFDHLVG